MPTQENAENHPGTAGEANKVKATQQFGLYCPVSLYCPTSLVPSLPCIRPWGMGGAAFANATGHPPYLDLNWISTDLR